MSMNTREQHDVTTGPQPTGETKETHTDRVKNAISEAERIRTLRDRLYARGDTLSGLQRHTIPPQSASVLHKTEDVVPTIQHHEDVTKNSSPETAHLLQSTVSLTDMPIKRKRSYRKIITLVGVVFFAGAAAVASLIMFSGTNTVSGENISVEVRGQIASGGGDELPFQIAVANQNAVPIQSATLIIEYPRGTQNPVDGKEMTIERKQLESIGAGELVNIEMKARVFGEENDEKEIRAFVEYRIAGSNATFKKEAKPYQFKISTSPVIATFDTIKTTASGQEHTLALTIQSNSSVALSNVLIKAMYPNGFDFSESDPDTVSGEDVWRIKELKPGEKKVITIKGVITGYDNDVRKFSATIGVAEESNKTTVDSILSQTETEVVVERPFLDTKITVNGQGGDTIVIDKNVGVSATITFENTLDTTIYDGRILVEIEGNALDESVVRSQGGYYDSVKNSITWDSVNVPALKEILPGETGVVSLVLNPKKNVASAPTITLNVTARGQRIFENNVSQEVVGTLKKVITIESKASIFAYASYDTGPFTNTGPMPPVAEKTTEYTLTFSVKAGNNGLTNAKVTTKLPQYVTWLNEVSDGDSVRYDKNARTLTWTVGDLAVNEEKKASVQISITPSLSQVNKELELANSPTITAMDTHTNTAIKSTANSIYSGAYNEESETYGDGQVRGSE